jgi:regulator of protease activity HflC (stomatin/prohibitin superfamily)
MEIILQFVNFLKELWIDIIFWFVVPQTQRAVIMRNGRYHRECGPGPHLKLPCIFSLGDEVNYVDSVMETTETDAQSLTTQDGQEVVVSAIIKHRVIDAKVYLLEVMDVKDALVDITMSKIKYEVMARTWEECRSDQLDNDVAKKARVEAKKWGVYIEDITIINLARLKSIRIIGMSQIHL